MSYIFKMLSTAMLVDNINLLNKAISPRLTNRFSLTLPYLELSAFMITSKLISRYQFNKEITLSSLGILIYSRLIGVFIVEVSAGLYLIKSHFRILRSTS